MAQDYAKRSKARTNKSAPRFFSLSSYVAGVITGVGLFLLGAYGPELLQRQQTQSSGAREVAGPTALTPDPNQISQPDAARELANPAVTAEDPAVANNDRPSLEFIFRDLLGEDEVDPDLEPYETTMQAEVPDRPMQYLLQSGSFLIKADAQSRRGTLLLMNLPATLAEASIDGKIWYRVIVGPYSQRGDAQQAVSRLRASDIASIWLERPLTEG